MKECEGETKDTEKIATFLDFVVFYMFIDYGKRNQYLSMLERVYDIVELEIDEVKKISKLEKLKSVSFIKMIFNRLTQLPECKDYILNNICPVILDIIYEAEQNNEDEFLKVDHEESKVVDQQEADVYHKIVKKIIRSIFDSSSDIPQIIKIFLQIVKIFYVNKMVCLRLNTNEKSPKCNSKKLKKIKEECVNLSKQFCLELIKSWFSKVIFENFEEIELSCDYPLTDIKNILFKARKYFNSIVSLENLVDNFKLNNITEIKSKSLLKLNEESQKFIESMLSLNLSQYFSEEFLNIESNDLCPYTKIEINCYCVSEQLLLDIYSTLNSNKVSIEEKELFDVVINLGNVKINNRNTINIKRSESLEDNYCEEFEEFVLEKRSNTVIQKEEDKEPITNFNKFLQLKENQKENDINLFFYITFVSFAEVLLKIKVILVIRISL